MGPFPRGIDLYFFREQTNKGFQNVSFPKYSGRSLLSLSLSSIFKVLSERKKKKTRNLGIETAPAAAAPASSGPLFWKKRYTQGLFSQGKSQLYPGVLLNRK